MRAKMFSSNIGLNQKPLNSSLQQLRVFLKLNFEVPVFTVELRGDGPNGEQGLVDLSFRDFVFNYEKCHKFETNVQVSLKSILMEDLLQPDGSRY